MELREVSHLKRNIKFKTMKRTLLFLALIFTNLSFSQVGAGDITGTILNANDKKPIYGIRVFLMDGDARYNARTNEDGRFRISAVPSGNYQVYMLKDGDTAHTENFYYIPVDGLVQAGEIGYSNEFLELKPVLASAKGSGLKLTNGFLPIKTLTQEDLEHNPVKFDLKLLTSSITTDVKLMDDGSLVFRGARKGDMIYMVDGVKINQDLSLPSAGIGSMMVYSGGLPAKYGDTMGGVVVVETASYFDLLREYNSQQMRNETK